MCHIDGKSAKAANSVKSGIINKVVDSDLSIITFEQQCVVLKGMLQSTRLKYHMKTIGIDLGCIFRINSGGIPYILLLFCPTERN